MLHKLLHHHGLLEITFSGNVSKNELNFSVNVYIAWNFQGIYTIPE